MLVPQTEDFIMTSAANFNYSNQFSPQNKNKKKLAIKITTPYFISTILTGCGIVPIYTSDNQMLDASKKESPQLSLSIRNDREIPKLCESTSIPQPKKTNSIVTLSLSGGGSRAAYFSALSMFELERIKQKNTDILHEVDVLSSVSGGSLAAAYYAISYDRGQECAAISKRPWEEAQVSELMTKHYQTRFFWKTLLPNNFIPYWFTHFDRSDLMAQNLADNLFDQKSHGLHFGTDLRLGELNPLRPNLILNTTVGSRRQPMNPDSLQFGDVFSFVQEDFSKINSSVSDYPLGKAVMATASFPGIFSFMTLQDLNSPNKSYYLHLFDGGNSDNLGLTSIKRVLVKNYDSNKTPAPTLVISIDAFTGDDSGVNPNDPDPRSAFSYFIDLNFLDASDSLLQSNRAKLLKDFKNKTLFLNDDNNDSCSKIFSGKDKKKYCAINYDWSSMNNIVKNTMSFVHVSFDSLIADTEQSAREYCSDAMNFRTDNCKLWRHLKFIPTRFNISDDIEFERQPETFLTDKQAIECATPLIFGRMEIQKCPGLQGVTPSNVVQPQLQKFLENLQFK
jgi:predicted acylesterase/phospholipase RssA